MDLGFFLNRYTQMIFRHDSTFDLISFIKRS